MVTLYFLASSLLLNNFYPPIELENIMSERMCYITKTI